MNIEFESQDIIDRFENSKTKLSKLSHCAETLILGDGRIAEIQIILTTKENEFCQVPNTMRGEAFD